MDEEESLLPLLRSISLNELTSSKVHMSVQNVSSITDLSGNFKVKILRHYVSKYRKQYASVCIIDIYSVATNKKDLYCALKLNS